jgi:hypothetical protein
MVINHTTTEGMGPKRFVLSVDDDTEFKSVNNPFFTMKYRIFPINLLKKQKSSGGV